MIKKPISSGIPTSHAVVTESSKATVSIWAWVRLGAIIALGVVTIVAGVISAAYGNDPDASVPAAIAVGSGALLAITFAFALYRHDSPKVPAGVSNRVSRLALKTAGGRTREELLVDFGRVVRFLFFAGTAAAGVAYLEAADTSAFHTPLAQLTLAAIGAAAARIVFVVTGALVWVRWAFSSEEKAYEAWGYFGLAGVLFGVVFFLRGTTK